ncbi:MAG TPA: hydantoinase B/oxoprolinase family protein, partial [Rhodopila sp.]|uniref:hydantoinase B/oxoprolinase family protein n=1 Tax=Rhodopila sp. TaxID=2480087 RepID=UPI002C1885A8
CTMRPDGGGEGQRRGGVGMIRKIRLLGDEGSYSVLSDRAVIPPFGVLGGGAGAPYHVSVETTDGRLVEFSTPGKVTGHPIYRGDVVVMRSSGGGGYGDPLDRPVDSVLTDIRTGLVTADRARDGYGVVVDNAGNVDQAATDALRQALRESRFSLRVIADDTIEPYTGLKGKRRIVRLTQADAESLGVTAGSLVEMLGRNPAPLRGWVRITDDDAGTTRLDAFARTVLAVGDGDRIRLRALAVPPLPNGMAG